MGKFTSILNAPCMCLLPMKQTFNLKIPVLFVIPRFHGGPIMLDLSTIFMLRCGCPKGKRDHDKFGTKLLFYQVTIGWVYLWLYTRIYIKIDDLTTDIVKVAWLVTRHSFCKQEDKHKIEHNMKKSRKI